MFRVFRRKADAARPARKQSFAQRGGWNLNVGCPAMTSTGYMTALGRYVNLSIATPMHMSRLCTGEAGGDGEEAASARHTAA
jgi:hypothetical protein